MQNSSLEDWKPESTVLHINSAAGTDIAFLNWRVFHVIFSSIQLSQDFKVSNGRRLNRKIPVKLKIKAKNFGYLVLSLHKFEIQRKRRIGFLVIAAKRTSGNIIWI